MSKKVLSLVLALVMVLGSFSFVSAAKYDDVTGTEYAEAVNRLSLLEILTGYPDGTFKPENTITRAEFAAVAVRAKGLANAAKAAEGLPTGFEDVPANNWASGIVGVAAKSGIVNGVGNGLFAPQAPVKYEEAVTMLVRALGYEAAAQAKGGYPYGYLIVANEVGLLDDVKGTQGAPASRGIVAQMTDNALEIPMMIQVGFGQDTKWVVSGSKEHGDNAEERYLLDDMGFDSVKGRVISVNTKTDKITVDPTDEDLKNVTLEVEEGFDFYEVEGLVTKFWSKDDVVVVYTVQEDAKFDAVEVDDDELTLVTEDKNYEVARNATLILDGKKVDQDEFNANYAKVVLNDDDEIIWAQGYTFDGFILVEEVKDEVAYSYDDFDEVDLEDFTIVKEGKTIGIDGIEEEDILFYNNDEEFAVVYNKGTEGELDRVYTDASFRFEGEAYKLTELPTPAIYFDEGKVGELNEEILDEFLDDEATITVFVDFAGRVVVVSGEVSSIGNSAYGVLTAKAETYEGRKGKMIALDIRNGANEKVEYDLAEKDIINKDIKLENIKLEELRELEKGIVLKISLDKDGDVTSIELPENYKNAKAFEIDDSNVKVGEVSYRLQSNTLVFYDETKKVETLGNAKDKFSEVEEGSTIYVEKGRVVAVVGKTDADTDTKDVTGLVTGVKRTTAGKAQFTVKVLGETQRLVSKDKYTQAEVDKFDKDYTNTIVTLVVGETSNEVERFDYKDGYKVIIDRISGRTIYGKDSNKKDVAVELNTKAVIYDVNDDFDELNLRELKSGMEITVYHEGSSARFVDYILVGIVSGTPTESGVVTYINKTTGAKIEIDGELYDMDENTRLLEDGKTIAVGGKDIATKLNENDVVKDVEVKNGVVVKMTLVKRADEAAAEKALEEALDAVTEGYALDINYTEGKEFTVSFDEALEGEEFPEAIEGFLADARITFDGKLPEGTKVTVKYGETPVVSNKAVEGKTELLLSELLDIDPKPFVEGIKNDKWNVEITGNLEAIEGEVTFVTVISNDDFETEYVIAEGSFEINVPVDETALEAAKNAALEAVNEATSSVMMKKALQNELLELDIPAAELDDVAAHVFEVRPEDGYENLAALKAAIAQVLE